MNLGVLLKGASVSLIVRVAGVGVVFFLHVLFARIMSQDEYGTYIFVINIVLMFSVLSKMGLSDGGVRFLAQYLGANDNSSFLGYIGFSTLVIAISSLGIAVIATIVYSFFPTLFNGVSVESLIWGIWLLPAISLMQHVQALFRGCKKIFFAQFVEQILVPLMLLFIAVIAFWKGDFIFGSDVLFWQTLCTVFGVVCLFRIFFVKFIEPKKIFGAEYNKMKDWIATAIPLFFGGVVAVLLSRVDIIIIGLLGGGSLVAGYGVADRVAGLLIFGLSAINAILAPVISELFHKNKLIVLQNHISRLTRMVLMGTIVIAIGMFFFSGEILGLFGDEYKKYSNVLAILVFAQLINVFFGPVGPLFTMTGNQRIYLKVMGVVCLFNLVVVPISYYVFSLEGVAYAKVMVFLVWNVSLAWYAKRKIGIDPMAFSSSRL